MISILLKLILTWNISNVSICPSHNVAGTWIRNFWIANNTGERCEVWKSTTWYGNTVGWHWAKLCDKIISHPEYGQCGAVCLTTKHNFGMIRQNDGNRWDNVHCRICVREDINLIKNRDYIIRQRTWLAHADSIL